MTQRKKIIQKMKMYKANSLKGTQIYTVDNSKFKIEINSDGYTDQSYVRLSKWTENEGFKIIANQAVSVYFEKFEDVHIGRIVDKQPMVEQFMTTAIKNMETIAKEFI